MTAICPDNGQQIHKMCFQPLILNGMNSIQIFTEQFNISQIVFQQLPALTQLACPWRSGRCDMRTGKDSISAQTIILSIQLFGMHQGAYLPDIFPICMIDPVVTRRPGENG